MAIAYMFAQLVSLYAALNGTPNFGGEKTTV